MKLTAIPVIAKKAYDEILDLFGPSPSADDIADSFDSLSPETKRLYNALERDDFLGFESADQALAQIIREPDETASNFDMSPQLKTALTKFTNSPPERPKRSIDEVGLIRGGVGGVGVGLIGLASMTPEEAEAALTQQMLKKAIKAPIERFEPPGGASLHSGPYDKGANYKSPQNVFGILTGENPNAERLPDWKNKLQTIKMANELVDRYGEDAVTLVKGMYENPERSFIVQGRSPLELAEIGNRYGQESVFTDRGLVMTQDDKLGTILPIKEGPFFDNSATNYYTEARATPKWGDPRNEKVQFDIDWDNPQQMPDISAPRTPAGAKGVHFSKVSGLLEADPDFYGTAAAGAEKARVVDEGAPNRTMFYTGESDLKPEATVGTIAPNRYEAKMDNLYDKTTDPEGLNEFSKNPTDFEQSVQARGYEGYTSETLAEPKSKRTGSIVKFTPTALVAASAAQGARVTPEQAKEAGFGFSEYLDYQRMMDYLEADLGPLDRGEDVGTIEAINEPDFRKAAFYNRADQIMSDTPNPLLRPELDATIAVNMGDDRLSTKAMSLAERLDPNHLLGLLAAYEEMK